jgi:threonine dehydrogenase-like Zn-dependent dehydrogenase
MRAAVFRGAFAIQVEQIPDASILAPTDAVVRITHACICGTDLWPYRGQGTYQPGWQIGHEWMGMVEDVGSEVRTLKRGDRVIASYDFCDGTCEFCRKGLDSACVQGGVWGYGHEGGQAEAIRARFADATLVALPSAVEGDEALLKALLPLTDNMAAGHHAAVCAGVRPGGTEEAITMAVNMTRPGGTVGFVGAPHGSGQIPLGRMFSSNIGVRGGLAPARAYLPELLNEVLAGRLDPSPILDMTLSLAEVAAGYAAMDQRQAIKVLVRP